MFEKEELDIVYICLPPFAHSNEVELAAEKGIHIFRKTDSVKYGKSQKYGCCS
ncbi:MAG: hypothetical protein FGF52_03850 [Candidatus Brockarchaeota archaeon]|nr:hypothetical protein [Candidatus Brockarchaeota archaeon]